MTPAFASGAIRWFLILHALLGMAGLAASVHLARGCWSLLRHQSVEPRRLQRSAFAAASFVAGAIAVGLLLYPHYRVNVRGYFLDARAPWASNLFDIKEHVAALALPLAAVPFVVRKSLDAQSPLLPVCVFCAFVLVGVAAFCTVTGLLVTSVHGI